MSLTAPYARVFYVSDGITSVFSFPFVGINRDYIRVNVQLPSGTVQNNVSVSIPLKPNGELVGNIVFGADQVPPAGSKIMIQRITPATQDTNYAQSIQFDSGAVDFSFDKLTARMQEVMDRINNSMVGVHPFQEFAINLQQMTTANQNQYLQMDFANKLIKAGLFMELMNPSGRFRVSNNGADWTFLPKSNEVQEFRQRTLTNPLRYIFEYRIGDKWYAIARTGEPLVMNHNDLDNRNAEDCHPQSAITGLVELLKTLAVKATDFQTGITDQNKGITQAEYQVLDDKINTAALSGTNIGTYWFGLTGNQPGFVVPNPTSADQNYYDFTTSNFYTAKADLTGWNLAGSNPPPADIDVNIVISAKFWDITEQTGQQGGLATWSHTNSKWGYAPRIVSFENAKLSGVSTAPSLTSDSPSDQIVNKETAQGFTLENNNYQGVIVQTLAETNNIVFNQARKQIVVLNQNTETPVAAATISMTFPEIAPTDCWTYQVRIKVGDNIPVLTWTNNVKWFEESTNQPVKSNATALFVFQVIGTDIIGNYAGSY